MKRPRSRPSLQEIATELDRQLNPYRHKHERRQNGFVLIVFKQGIVDKPRCVSTLLNGDLRKMIKLVGAELEGRISDNGHA